MIPKSGELDALRSANAVNVAIERERRRFANDPNYPFSIAVAKPSASPDLAPVSQPPTQDAETLVRQWIATLQNESHVTDEDAEDLTLRIIAYANRSLQPPSPQSEEIAREIVEEMDRNVRAVGHTDCDACANAMNRAIAAITSALTSAQINGLRDAMKIVQEQPSTTGDWMTQADVAANLRRKIVWRLQDAIRAAKQP